MGMPGGRDGMMAENTLKVLWHDWKRRKHGDRYDQIYADLYLKDDFGGRLKRCVDKMDLQPNDILLDVGCGTGMLFDAIKESGARYLGWDTSAEMLIGAMNNHKHNYPQAKFYKDHMGIREIPNKTAMFDFVEHVKNEHLSRMLSSHAKKWGGRLYIHTPNGDYFMEKLKKWGLLPQISGHIAIRNGTELAALLARAGFHVTKIEYLPHYTPLLRWTHWLSNLPRIGKFFKARLWIEAYS